MRSCTGIPGTESTEDDAQMPDTDALRRLALSLPEADDDSDIIVAIPACWFAGGRHRQAIQRSPASAEFYPAAVSRRVR
jgi:hypothetical protein